MPDRENVRCRVYITVLSDTTLTRPFTPSPAIPFGLLSGKAPKLLQVWVVYASFTSLMEIHTQGSVTCLTAESLKAFVALHASLVQFLQFEHLSERDKTQCN